MWLLHASSDDPRVNLTVPCPPGWSLPGFRSRLVGWLVGWWSGHLGRAIQLGTASAVVEIRRNTFTTRNGPWGANVTATLMVKRLNQASHK